MAFPFSVLLLFLLMPPPFGAPLLPSRHGICPGKCECQRSIGRRQKEQPMLNYNQNDTSAEEEQQQLDKDEEGGESEDEVEDVHGDGDGTDWPLSVRCVRGGTNDSEFLSLLQSLPADVRELEVRGTAQSANNFQWNENINRLSRLSRLALANSAVPALSQSIRLPLLRSLDLSGNNLEHIQLGSFLGMPMLERLDLSRNRISVLPTGAFIYLKRLSSLSLSYNRLNRELTTGNLLRGPRALKELQLDGNRLSAGQLNQLLAEVGTLKRLEANHCGLNDAEVLALNLSKVPQLERIGLAGNNLSEVPSSTLRALALLRTVDLSHNLLRSLGPCAFCGSNISRVFLSHNLLGIGGDLRPIHREAFAETRILELDLSYNQLDAARFSSEMLQGAQESLEVLHISGNGRVALDAPQLIGTLPRLRALHVADSALGTVPYSLPKAYGQLTLLNLSGNGLDHLPPNLGSMLPHLQVIDLSRNHFSSFPHSLVTFIHRLRMVFLHNCPWDCQCAAQPLQLHMLRRLDHKEMLRYDETLCAEPPMLRGQPLHRVQKINDCAILFGANYGITQNTELLLILGALLLAALFLSAFLALLLYFGRESTQKGTYVTGEGVGEEDGKRARLIGEMSKSMTMTSSGSNGTAGGGGGGRAMIDLDAMAMNGSAIGGRECRQKSADCESPLLLSNSLEQLQQRSRTNRQNGTPATTATTAKSSLAALAVQNLHFAASTAPLLAPSASLATDRLKEPLLLPNSPLSYSSSNTGSSNTLLNISSRTRATMSGQPPLTVLGTLRRTVPSGTDRQTMSHPGAGDRDGGGAKALITF
ncbi:hypothetical protein niasHS_014596 [Heterodera schachtii]|uniref:LRRCT domain-containing protein n=1 Tax=Heterodera schachtii TaxID=97005 RepID=A0ABD2IF24_HETSC